MTESDARTAGPTAGSLLREAREKQGLHVAALAAALKVSPRKLEALEGDRYDELPDAAFVRALAQSMCRALRIDARPVLALLPRPDAASLEQVAGPLNTPFRDRGSREESGGAGAAIRPLLVGSALLMVAAIVLWLLPSSLWEETEVPAPAAPAASAVVLPALVPASAVTSASAAAAPPAASAASAPVAMPAAPAVPAVPAASASAPGSARTAPGPAAAAVVAPSTPPAAPAAAPSAKPMTAPATAATPPATPAPAAAGGALRLAATGTSWVEVQDARGQIVFSRTLQAGESAAVDGVAPLRLVIGNAGATTLTWRGRSVDLAQVARSNVARLELP